MPRQSPYQIVLSPEEEQELSARAQKYSLPYFQVQRSKMILLAAQGLDSNEIARRLDTRRKVVWLWCKRFYEKQLRAWTSSLARVAPGLFPPEIVVQVKALACELPSTYHIPLLALEQSGFGGSSASIRIGRKY